MSSPLNIFLYLRCRGGKSCIRRTDFNLIDMCKKYLAGRTKMSLEFFKSMDDNFITSKKNENPTPVVSNMLKVILEFI